MSPVRADRIRIDLKYGQDGEKVINEIQAVQQAGSPHVLAAVSRIFLKLLEWSRNLHSSARRKAVLSDSEAREKNTGGEVLATVW